MVEATAPKLLIPILPSRALYGDGLLTTANSIMTVWVFLYSPIVTSRSITPKGLDLSRLATTLNRLERSIKSGEEDTDEDEGHGLDDEGHGLDNEGRSIKSDRLGLEGEEEAVPEGQQWASPVVKTAVGEPIGLGYRALRHRELAVEEDHVYNMFEVGPGSRSVLEPERPKRVSTLRQPTPTTWIDPEDGIAYIDVPAYPPPTPPTQTLPSPEWSSGLLPVSLAPSAVPPPISSPMILLTVPSPIALPVATPIVTILVDEDQFIEIGAQLELYGGILQDHTQRLDTMSPTLSLELEQERTTMTFGALWRPVLALEAWTGHVDTRMADMSWVRYDDHRLIHDMLVQQAALQRELQEMRGRVTALEER
ncbi:hypothetical protein Tco_0811294 [Tanacetum coccineum]